MKRLTVGLFAIGLISTGVAYAEESAETTKTHETDGKKTTHSRKVKHKDDGAGNSEVKTTTTDKTEASTPTGKGGDKSETVRTHETDGKKTRQSSKVERKAGADGSEVKTETTNKTDTK